MTRFVRNLCASGLLSREDLESYLRGLPASERPDSADALPKFLVERKKLTKYQAYCVSVDKHTALVLGNYEILEPIGSGGMGMVFKAVHRRLKRTVALKVLPLKFTRSKERVARFQREVEAYGGLRHPNIVMAFDADVVRNIPFLVTEYVEGCDLNEFVKHNGPVSVEQAVNYIKQAAEGLQYAHAQGIIHRDVKPANLLLNTDGRVLVLDLGLARIQAATGASTNLELSQSGGGMGTVDYMAPEQALDAKHVDGRVDIYSLGCTLYYLLTGKTVCGGETQAEKLLWHQVGTVPSLLDLDCGATPRLEGIFQKMMSRRPADRYGDMAALIAELDGLAHESGDEMSDMKVVDTSVTALKKFLLDIQTDPPDTSAHPLAGSSRSGGSDTRKSDPTAKATRGSKPRQWYPILPVDKPTNWLLWGGVAAAVVVVLAVGIPLLLKSLTGGSGTALNGATGQNGESQGGAPDKVAQGTTPATPVPPKNGAKPPPSGQQPNPPEGNGGIGFVRPQWNQEVFDLIEQNIEDGLNSTNGKELYTEIATCLEQKLAGRWAVGAKLMKDGAAWSFIVDPDKASPLDKRPLTPEQVKKLDLQPDSVSRRRAREFALPRDKRTTLTLPKLYHIVDDRGEEYIAGHVMIGAAQERVVENLTLNLSLETKDNPEESAAVSMDYESPTLVLKPANQRHNFVTAIYSGIDFSQPGTMHLRSWELRPKPGYLQISNDVPVVVEEVTWNQELLDQLRPVFASKRRETMLQVYGDIVSILEKSPPADESFVWGLGKKLTAEGNPARIELKDGKVSITMLDQEEAEKLGVDKVDLTFEAEAPTTPVIQELVQLGGVEQLRFVRTGTGWRLAGDVTVQAPGKLMVSGAHLEFRVRLQSGRRRYVTEHLPEAKKGLTDGQRFVLDVTMPTEIDVSEPVSVQLQAFVFFPKPMMYALCAEQFMKPQAE